MVSSRVFAIVAMMTCCASAACTWFPWSNNCPDPHKFPEQIRVAFAGKTGSTGMAVSWTTMQWTQSFVELGTSSGQYTQNATGDWPTSYFVSWQHNVVLSNLQPSTKYYYRVGDPQDTTGGISQEFSFTTKPQDGHNPDASFSIGVMGDMGTSFAEGTLAGLLKLQQKQQTDFNVQLGDFAYADDRAASAYEDQQNAWGKFVEPLAANAALLGLPGNHEAGMWDLWRGSPAYDLVGNFSAYRARFRFPYQESGSASNMWYSFDYANVHFVVVDTETDYLNAPYTAGGYESEKWGPFNDALLTQTEWLRADLEQASANRAIRPWIIVMGHRPVYKASKSFGPPSHYVQDFLEELFWQHQVDLYLCGHVHAYTRVLPTYKNVVTANATTYIVAGNGGNVEGQNTIWSVPQPNNIASKSLDFGYGQLNIVDSENLEWIMYNNETQIIDKFALNRPRL